MNNCCVKCVATIFVSPPLKREMHVTLTLEWLLNFLVILTKCISFYINSSPPVWLTHNNIFGERLHSPFLNILRILCTCYRGPEFVASLWVSPDSLRHFISLGVLSSPHSICQSLWFFFKRQGRQVSLWDGFCGRILSLEATGVGGIEWFWTVRPIDVLCFVLTPNKMPSPS